MKASPISWRLIILLAGAIILVYVVYRLGPGNLATTIIAVGPLFFLMPLVYGLGTALHSFGFYFLLAPIDRPPVSASIASRFSATTLNTILPLAGVGGEPTRLLWLEPPSRQGGVAALILDRILLIMADATFLLVSISIIMGQSTLSDVMAWGAAATVASAMVIGIALYWVSAHKGFALATVKLVNLFCRKRDSLAGRATEVDAIVRKMWREKPRQVAMVYGIHLAARVLVISEIWVGLWILGVPVTLTTGLIVSSLQIALSMVLAMVPSQLGVQEAAQALIFTSLGLNPVLGVSLVFLQRIRQLLFTPVGFFLLSRAPKLENTKNRS